MLFEYQGVKNINAEIVLNRPVDMKLLEKIVTKTDSTNFVLPRHPKLVQAWSCEWTAKDDAMLLVGVYKFGYGSWVQIRDDPLLGLQNKLFLENPAAGKDATANQDGKESVKKVPGSVHLGRRVDYLFTLLEMKNLIVQWADRRLSEVLERELGNQHQFRTTVVAATAAIILSLVIVMAALPTTRANTGNLLS